MVFRRKYFKLCEINLMRFLAFFFKKISEVFSLLVFFVYVFWWLKKELSSAETEDLGWAEIYMSLNFPAKPFSSSQHRTTAPPYVLHDVIYFVGCEIAPRQRNFGRVWLFGQLRLLLASPIPATLSMGLARAKVPTRRRSSLCSSLHHYHQFKSRKSANVVVSRKIFRQLSVS